jgi:hypothetical protein
MPRRLLRHQVYTRAGKPFLYWFTLSMLFVLGAPLFSAALRASTNLVKNWSGLPNRLPLAGVSLARIARSRSPPAARPGRNHRRIAAHR